MKKLLFFAETQSDLTCRIIVFLIAPDFHDKVTLSVNFFQYSMVFVIAVLSSNLMNKINPLASLHSYPSYDKTPRHVIHVQHFQLFSFDLVNLRSGLSTKPSQ